MANLDFGVGWPEPEEKDYFLLALESECIARAMSFRIFTEPDLPIAIQKVKRGNLRINFFLDMASNIYDNNDLFTRFVYRLKDNRTYIVDEPDEVKSAADKSITHFKLLNANIPVPYTIVIRHWEPSSRLKEKDKLQLGSPFVVKPALGYGQKGVKIISGNRPFKQIADARLYDPGDNFLIQEFVQPIELKGRLAWFRIYNLFGEIIPCWWNPETHEYYHVTLKEMHDYQLLPLVKIAADISNVVKIDWFSCEIAISNKDRNFYVIDYINDQCAIYPKSQHKDGVPDDVITKIAERLVEKAWRHKRGESSITYRSVWFPKIKINNEIIS